MPNKEYVGRFAPSPTGPLHMGSMVVALASWWLARQAHGFWLVRIEDIDRPREVTGAAKQQIACLAAFGMEPDAAILWQHQRDERYQSILQTLIDSGHAFTCHCSRSDLSDDHGIHRNCVAEPTHSQFSMRLRAPEKHILFHDQIQGEFQQQLKREVGDVVLKRADGLWAYQLAVVVDDADQDITHVVRGADLLDSTPRQIYLQQLLGFPSLNYAHLPLVLDQHGNKLSKSELSVPVDPSEPMSTLNYAWQHLGQAPEIMAGITSMNDFHKRAIVYFQPLNIPRTAKRQNP